jgi:crotonobetainyl-CoA:carnitine CoA-transferase CaiB-like acyl-CoA transferase
MDLVGLSSDPRFATFQGRTEHRDEVEAHVRDWVAARSSEEVFREFRRVDAAIAPVYDMAQIFKDPHYLARGMIAEVDSIKMQNVIARLSKSPGRLRHAGRPFNADTEAVLAQVKAPDAATDT